MTFTVVFVYFTPLGPHISSCGQVFLEQLEGELESENPWERVVSLVDTQAEMVEDFKDKSRMTSILIQLKNDPLDVSIRHHSHNAMTKTQKNTLCQGGENFLVLCFYPLRITFTGNRSNRVSSNAVWA